MNLKILKILAAFFLILAIFNMPSGYYTFLRIFITTISVICVIHFWNNQSFWSIVFLISAIIFNPIFKIYFYEKSIWIVIDIVFAILFLVAAFITKKKKIQV